MLQLVAVSNDLSILSHLRGVHIDGDLTARRHRPEVVGPCRQFPLQGEAVKMQVRLVVLYLAEVEYLAHELYKDARVAPHHLQHHAMRSLHGVVLQQLISRSGDKRQRRA